MTVHQQSGFTLRSRLKWLGRFALSAGLLAWLLSRTDLYGIARLLGSLPPVLLLALFGASLGGVLVAAYKWKLFLPFQPVGLLFRLNLVGVFYSMILPGQIAGEIVKAYRLGKGFQDAEVVAASVLLDKATGLIALVILGMAGISFGRALPDSSVAAGLGTFIALAIGGLVALRVPAAYSAVRAAIDWTRTCIGRAPALFAKLLLFVEAWRGYLYRPATMLASLALGIALQLVHVCVIVILSRALGIQIPPADWLWIFAVVSIAVIIPITLGGVGIREGAFVATLGVLRVPSEQALALSLTIFTLQLAAAALGAAIEVVGVRRGA